MNLFKEEIGRSYLEHSQKGQTWGKHKYIAIKNGRYIYPEDLKKGQNVSADKRIQSRMDYINAHQGKREERRSMLTTGSSQAIESAKRRAQSNSRMYYKTGPGKSGTEAMDKAMADTARRKQMASPEYRSRQINDQIKSAHSNATSSKMQLTPGSELKKRAEERAATKSSSTSTTSTKSSEELKSIADKIKANNTSSAPKKEEKKTESTNMSTETATTTASTSTETKKSGSGKGRKGSSSKKSSSKKDTTKTDTNQANTVTPASASEEAKSLGLSEQDLKTLELSIDINSTERESVLKSLAFKVIRGDFGNGDERKKKLGKYYAEIQKKVNEFMREMKSGKNVEEVKHSDYLEHIGVKKRSGRYPYGSGERPYQHGGPSWGVSRYQNRDGSLTELGKRRLGVENVGDSPTEKRKAHAGIHANVSTDNRNIGNVLNSGSTGARTGSGMAKKAANREREKKRREMDVSNMSDQDLQKAVNRMNLERNYKNLKTQDIATGKDYVADVLDVVGDVASIGASAAMIASAIYMIKR